GGPLGGPPRRGPGHDRSGGDITVNVTNIRIGADASGARYWDYRSGYGIAPAPAGQEYRVINGQLVLVDSQTLQVVALMGLLSALINCRDDRGARRDGCQKSTAVPRFSASARART
uniref:hypothetical protein n=1 Tax=Pararhodobacter marinus TaxID=2184063 RepID=UPI003518A1F7